MKKRVKLTLILIIFVIILSVVGYYLIFVKQIFRLSPSLGGDGEEALPVVWPTYIMCGGTLCNVECESCTLGACTDKCPFGKRCIDGRCEYRPIPG